MILTFKDTQDKRINPDMHWVYLIHSILLSFNSKLVHSAFALTPKEAREPSKEVAANVNMKLQANHNRKCLELNVGDKVYIYIYT